MNTRLVKNAAQYVAIGGVLLFFIVLLTMVFSFLGTIICAALAGMMMGATKPSRWLSVASSLVFPAVIGTVLEISKSELTGRQIGLVSFLCFGAFWLTYCMAAWVMVFERHQKASGAPTPGPAPALTRANIASDTMPAAAAPVLTEAVAGLQWAELQGEWACERCGADGQPRRWVIEIKGGKLVLRSLDSSGRVCACTQASLKLEGVAGAQTLVLAPVA